MGTEQIIQLLGLKPHPEGGFYKEVYKSDDFIEKVHLKGRFNGDRRFCTAIYYLLQGGDFSAFHRIKSDELWHYYAGGDITFHLLDKNGYQQNVLGNQLNGVGSFQVTIPANVWFAAERSKEHPFSLAGCTVSPGFDFDDFEIADRYQMLQQYPQHGSLINRLCR